MSLQTLSGLVSVTGMDFSTSRKMNMLLSLRTLIELGMLKWAGIAKGIKMQLNSYDPMLDRGGEPKIAQDIVATLSMAAFVIRAYYNIGVEDETENRLASFDLLQAISRNFRSPVASRDFRK
jgi:hypothetical protein